MAAEPGVMKSYYCRIPTPLGDINKRQGKSHGMMKMDNIDVMFIQKRDKQF
jgi:hypothetical protein